MKVPCCLTSRVQSPAEHRITGSRYGQWLVRKRSVRLNGIKRLFRAKSDTDKPYYPDCRFGFAHRVPPQRHIPGGSWCVDK